MTGFARRLEKIRRDGNLTVADLARWLRRPYATVNGWTKGGALGGAPLDRKQVLAGLTRLERAIKRGKDLPVPSIPLNRRAGSSTSARPRLSTTPIG